MFFYVVVNKGNVYNWSIGKFIVFIDGIYVFFVVVNVYGSKILYLKIVYNGLSKVRMYICNGVGYMMGINMVVF